MSNWLAELRRIHDESFEFDWGRHLSELNRDYEICKESRFTTTAPGVPPVWFNGDVEAIVPKQWTLVVSINPASNPLSEEKSLAKFRTPEASWNSWRTYNREVVRTQSDFFGKLAALASSIRGDDLETVGPAQYATRNMVFTELWPYSSRGWPPAQVPRPKQRWKEVFPRLLETDIGALTASRVNAILLNDGKPGLVLINGAPATEHLPRAWSQLRWLRREYLSKSAPKRLWHFEGTAGEIPIIGFPQLRRAKTHNSDVEIHQLAEGARQFVATIRE